MDKLGLYRNREYIKATRVKTLNISILTLVSRDDWTRTSDLTPPRRTSFHCNLLAFRILSIVKIENASHLQVLYSALTK